MLTIDDFNRQSALEYGEDGADGVTNENSVYLILKQPYDGLPELRVRIWPRHMTNTNSIQWEWNWRRTEHGEELSPPPDGVRLVQIAFVDGKDSFHYSLSYDSIEEAAEAALVSINTFIQDELPEEQRRRSEKEQVVRDALERERRIQEQINNFLGT